MDVWGGSPFAAPTPAGPPERRDCPSLPPGPRCHPPPLLSLWKLLLPCGPLRKILSSADGTLSPLLTFVSLGSGTVPGTGVTGCHSGGGPSAHTGSEPRRGSDSVCSARPPWGALSRCASSPGGCQMLTRTGVGDKCTLCSQGPEDSKRTQVPQGTPQLGSRLGVSLAQNLLR